MNASHVTVVLCPHEFGPRLGACLCICIHAQNVAQVNTQHLYHYAANQSYHVPGKTALGQHYAFAAGLDWLMHVVSWQLSFKQSVQVTWLQKLCLA